MSLRVGSYMLVHDRPRYAWEDNPPGSFTPRPARIATGLFHRSGPATRFISSPGWSGIDIDTVVTGFVQNVNWSDLQTDAGTSLIHPNPIDTAIDTATSRGLQLKVRMFTGRWSPAPVKSIGGAPLTYYDPVDTLPDGSPSPYTMCRHWLPGVQDAVDDLMTRVSGYYGDSTAIVDWACAGPMTKYAEPMIKQLSYADNRSKLVADGFTYEGDQAAFARFQRACLPFRTFTASLACNPYQHLYPDATYKIESGPTSAIMDAHVATLGHFASLGNNSLRDPVSAGAYPNVYAKLTTMPCAKYIQTAAPAKVGNLNNTCNTALSYGASMIEAPGNTDQYLSSGSATGLSPSQAASITAGLAANAVATMAAWT